MENKAQPGRTLSFTITVKDKDGVVQDLDNYTGLAAIISGSSNEVIAQYSRVTKPSYLPIVVQGPPANGVVKIILPADRTKNLEHQQLFVEFIGQVTSGSTIYKIGMNNGEKAKLVYITQSALTMVIDLA